MNILLKFHVSAQSNDTPSLNLRKIHVMLNNFHSAFFKHLM